MFYHRPINKIQFDPSLFDTIIDFALSDGAKWRSGCDQNGLTWNVEELSLDLDQFPILKEISQGIQNEFKRPSFFLSKVLPGGLVNHIDHRKWCNLLIPLYGPFEDNPIFFHDQFNNIIEKYEFSKKKTGQYIPVIINTRAMHSLPLKKTVESPRINLVMDLFDWPGHLFDKVDNDTIWNSTTNFIYKV